MRLVQTLILLVGAAHAAPPLQQPLPLGPCTIVATDAHWADPVSISESEPCTIPNMTTVIFNEIAPTYYGEEVYLTGGISDLGDWNTTLALHLNSSEYTEKYPLWYVAVDLPVNATIEYKFIKKEYDGSIVWESDPNREYTVEGNCDGIATVNGTWK